MSICKKKITFVKIKISFKGILKNLFLLKNVHTHKRFCSTTITINYEYLPVVENQIDVVPKQRRHAQTEEDRDEEDEDDVVLGNPDAKGV